MGFWDAQVADLAAAGVRLSTEERSILQHGGTVMCLAELPDPCTYQGGCDHIFLDVRGEPVMVPLLVEVAPADAMYDQTTTLVAQVDDNWGKGWRQWPAYVGELVCGYEDRWGEHFYYWSEEARPYRPWTCRPLVDENDMAVFDRLVEAAHARLDVAQWFELDRIFWSEAQNGIAMEDVCVALGLAHPTDDYEPPKYLGHTSPEDVEDMEAEAKAYAGMCNDHYVFAWTWDAIPNDEIAEIDMRPMGEFLADDPEASRVWFGILARRRHALAKIASVYYSGGREYGFHWSERFFG